VRFESIDFLWPSASFCRAPGSVRVADLLLAQIPWNELALVRHAHATLLDSTGAPIRTPKALPGHLSSEINRETHMQSVPADARRAVEDVERLLATKGSVLGPNWTQVPTQPGTGGFSIN
jgi:hypothetical protein